MIYAVVGLGVLMLGVSTINAHTSDIGFRILCGAGLGWCVGTLFMMACYRSYERIWRR